MTSEPIAVTLLVIEALDSLGVRYVIGGSLWTCSSPKGVHSTWPSWTMPPLSSSPPTLTAWRKSPAPRTRSWPSSTGIAKAARFPTGNGAMCLASSKCRVTGWIGSTCEGRQPASALWICWRSY